MTPMQALDKVVEAVGQSELARRLAKITGNQKISPAHIYNWRNRDEAIPAYMVLAVEKVAQEEGLDIDRHGLRPDVYPRERAA